MNIKIAPSMLIGSIDAVSSKSIAHRLIIAAMLANEKSVIELNAISDDIKATLSCVEALGGRVEYEEGKVIITPISPENGITLSCNQSGTTARFMLPITAALLDNFSLTADNQLCGRPVSDLVNAMRENGCKISSETLPLSVSGKLLPGKYTLPGNVSSQYISALLLALPLLSGDSEIILTTPIESESYINLTREVMYKFGVEVLKTDTGFTVKGNQKYITPGILRAEGDWTNAANWLIAGIEVDGLSYDSLQGDKKILEVLQNGIFEDKFDASQTPDLVPAIAVFFSLLPGKREIINASRLRLKESDRIKSTVEMINSLGGKACETENGIIIEGTNFKGGRVNPHDDHRIAMAAAIAGAVASGETVIENADCVNKSYPTFFDDYRKLGGKADVI